MSTAMPDVANYDQTHDEMTLSWVGMDKIALPLTLKEQDTSYHVHAFVEALVNLCNSKAKGIHMSRLYLALDTFSQEQTLTPRNLTELLSQFVFSHEGLSDEASLNITFDLPLRRSSLLSERSGWKYYACKIKAQYVNQQPIIELSVDVPYSSTCPCSAALARQLIQQEFEKKFAEHTELSANDVSQWLGTTDGIVATPHSQRSQARITVTLDQLDDAFSFVALIDLIESTLKTAVQTAVKREDEQEFARLNGQNLMFVEDASRQLKAKLMLQEQYQDFWLRVEHYESLHAHNAVAEARK